MTLSQEQKDLIAGTLLGDGSLQTESQGKNWRYCAIQKDVHKPYLEYKYNTLKPLCTTGLIYSEVFDERTGKFYKRNYFNTTVQPSLRYYANMFYTYDPKLGKYVKDVPKNVDDILTPRAMSLLYQDDGALKWKKQSNAMRICTESFSKEGVIRLQQAILKNFSIETKVGALFKINFKETNLGEKVIAGYRVNIPEASSGAFRELIKPYLIDCMKYKVSDGNYDSLGD